MITKSVLLPCPREKAFQLFTERISEWWPTTHRLTRHAASELFLEQTGRFWVRAGDGSEIELGRVLVWDPPQHLALDFDIGTSAAQPTAVEITFSEENGGTRVIVQHRPKPESEELWNQRAPLYEKSWSTVLGCLAIR